MATFPSSPQRRPLGVALTRTAVFAVILIIVLAAALAIDRLPGLHKPGRGIALNPRLHVALPVKAKSPAQRGWARPAATHKSGHKGHVAQRASGCGPWISTIALSRTSRKAAIGSSPVALKQTSRRAEVSRERRAEKRLVAAQAHHHGQPAQVSSLSLPAGSAQTDQRAYLSLYVNNMPQGEVLAIIHDGHVWLALADLQRAGLHGIVAPTLTFNGQPYVSLQSLEPGIASVFDERALSVTLTAQTGFLGSTTVDMGGYAPPGLLRGKSTSAFVNYALDWQNFNSLSEFSEVGVSSHGNLYYSSLSFQPGGKFVRGLTNATFDNPSKMTRWVIGDAFAQSGLLGGSTFLGGISVSRNFSLNPYYVRYPGVGLTGQVLTPSTAEIYVNGHLVGTRNLAPGSFAITNVPVVAGGGTTQVLVRDAYGRTQTFTSSYYFSTNTLQRGLSEFSYNLGAQRLNVTSASGDYGKLVFAGFDRVGITDWFTGGGRLDAGAGLVSVGPTAALRLGHGQLGLNASYSDASGMSGGAAEADYTYQNSALSYGGTLATMSARYANLSLAPSADRPTSLAAVFAGFAIGPRASVTLTYSASDWRTSGPRQEASLAGSVRLSNRFDLVVAAQHFHEVTSSSQYSASLSYQIGRNVLAAVSQQGGTTGSGSAVSIQQSLPLGTGVGYRFEHGNGTQLEDDDLVQVQTSYGLYQASYLQTGNVGQKDLLASGALVDAGDGIMFTRAVEDGFAVIDLPGLRGVRGYFNNQEVGRTDGRGRLLVPNLISYYGNRLGINDQDVPLNYSVDATEVTIATPYRGGALVRFPVKRETAVTGTVVLAEQRPFSVPAFGQLRLVLGGGKEVVSELDEHGAFYVEDVLPGRYPAQVEYATGTCALELDVPAPHGVLTQLGAVRCSAQQVGQRAP